MGEDSKIEWTTHTFNPWMGCTMVSAGCANCYAKRDSERYGRELWGDMAKRQVTSDANWRKPLKWAREAKADGVRPRVFCASWADVFEDKPELTEPRGRLWLTIQATPELDWLILTKRPENIARLGRSHWATKGWPPNIWLGTSAEDQATADCRVPELLKVPAHVRFLSCEPLLGPVDLTKHFQFTEPKAIPFEAMGINIQWVIAGGESGPNARPMDPAWARSLRDQCAEVGAAFFMKQMGGNWDKHGALHQLPEDLRIRQYPLYTPPKRRRMTWKR